MKTININHIVLRMQMIIPVLLFLIASCDQYEFRTSSDAPLMGTVWKLEAVVSSDTIKPIGTDNEKSYRLLFEPDGNAYGFSFNNDLWGKYTFDVQQQSIHTEFYPLTDVLEPPEGKLFLDRLSKAYRYVLSGDVLRLYFSENECLHFRATADDGSIKRIFSDTSEAMPLKGTVWKLEGFGSVRGKLDIAKPALEKNYQLLLEPDGKAYGKSSVNHLAGKYTLDEEKQTLGIDLQVLTEALDTPDGRLYLERLSKIYRYELQDNILRLYYSEEEYLQYRPAADETSSLEEIPGFSGKSRGKQ